MTERQEDQALADDLRAQYLRRANAVNAERFDADLIGRGVRNWQLAEFLPDGEARLTASADRSLDRWVVDALGKHHGG